MFGSLLLTAAVTVVQAPGPMPLPPAPSAAAQAAPTQPAPSATKKNGNGEEKKDEDEKKDEEKKEPEKYFLMKVLEDTYLGRRLQCRGINVSGSTELSYTASTNRVSNLPQVWNDRADFWLLQQNNLHIDKAIDTGKKEFQLGFTTDVILPGTDYKYTMARGFLDSQLTNGVNGGPRQYGIDVYQFYAEAFLPAVGPGGTVVKVGRFSTILEYETNNAVLTPFVSRSYLFHYNPFTHTGVYGTTTLNDDWSVGNGVVLGNDNFIDRANRPTYLGQVRWAPKDGPTTIQFSTSVTDPRYDANNAFNFYNVYNLQVTHKFCDRLSYVMDAAYSHTYGVPGLGFVDWYGLVNYLTFKHTEKLSTTLRAEVFNDTKGYRTGSEGLYTGVTYWAAYSPVNWLIFRPGVRYDYNGESAPFEGKHYLWTGVFDMIVRW